MVGKVNFTNLSRYSTLNERSYRRQYDAVFEFMALNGCLISQAIAPGRFQVGAIDCSFVPKSGKATYGVDRFYNGKASRAEPGLEISTIAVVDVGASMAYALSVQQTPAELETTTEIEALSRVEYLSRTGGNDPSGATGQCSALSWRWLLQ